MKDKKETTETLTTEPIHRGVGLLIGNESHSQFFIQIKDETYPMPRWRGACAFWGGAMEPEDASELAAVLREVEEEIPAALPCLNLVEKDKVDTFWVENDGNPFWLTIFEAIVSDKELQTIANVDVLEGGGCLVSREELLPKSWIFGMDFIFKKYLELKDNR